MIRLSTITSIRGKLFLLVILSGSFALLLVGVLLFGYERIETRDAARRELRSQADIVADGSAAALAFSDEKVATDTLNALRADSSILEAATYTADGRPFAWYSRGPGSSQDLAAPRREGTYFEDGYLLTSQPIRLGGQQIGTVYLKASTREVDARMWNFMGIVSVVLVVSLALALLLSVRLQRAITQPLADLSNLARTVSVTKDYSARARRDTDGEIGFLVDSFNGMLERIEAREHALRESEERYALAARGANDGLWDWKLSTGEIYFSPRWNQMLGYEEVETRATPEAWFNLIHHADAERVKAEINSHLRGHSGEFASEFRIRQKNDAYVWVLSRGIAVRDGEGVAVRMAGSQTDITKGKVADPLTGLPNRLYFLDRLESAIEASRRSGVQLAVLFLDLDRFKLVNDSMGHAAGDALLEGIADRLRARLSAARTAGGAGESSLVARIGGDEFAVLLGRVTETSDATLLARRILTDLNEPVEIAGRHVFASLSIGVALGCFGGMPEELLRNADTAMYHAKTEGKGRFAVFDESMRKQAVTRLEIETELRNAIAGGQFVLHYQPQVSVVGGLITGFEALVRWIHPEKGLIFPGDFIPVAEEMGLIVPLGQWVLREACRQMAEWQDRFAFSPPLTVAVNVSFRQLTDAGFVGEVKAALAEIGLRPESLRLEMTESTVMKNPGESTETLRQLKALGLGLEIDDFGTGYSSLSHLSCLLFDTLKIDRLFVSQLGLRQESGEIVKTILELARSLRMDVVAEGVETDAQLQILADMSCARAQGYYFSRPLEAEAIPSLFEAAEVRHSFARLTGAEEDGRTGARLESLPGLRAIRTERTGTPPATFLPEHQQSPAEMKTAAERRETWQGVLQ